jgi:hypothetical protein
MHIEHEKEKHIYIPLKYPGAMTRTRGEKSEKSEK